MYMYAFLISTAYYYIAPRYSIRIAIDGHISFFLYLRSLNCDLDHDNDLFTGYPNSDDPDPL